MLVKDQDVIEAYNQKEFKGSVNTNSQFKGFSEAYYEGCEDGEKFSISDKIAEKDVFEILELTSN